MAASGKDCVPGVEGSIMQRDYLPGLGMFEADLQSVANIAEIFGALLVIIGVFFALVEIRHLRRQRRETAAMEIMRAFQSPDFTKALRLGASVCL